MAVKLSELSLRGITSVKLEAVSSDPWLLPGSVTVTQQRGLLTLDPSEGDSHCFSTDFFLTDALGILWGMKRFNYLLAEKVKRGTKKRHLWVVFIPPGV